MRELFDRLRSEGEAGIERLVSERALETVQLDFKLKRNSARGAFEDGDKKVFGKALSAFANSGGGLLIWGVDARKGDDGIDCAQGSEPIREIERFESDAVRLVGELLIPRHDGIEIARITSGLQDGAGYLLVLVERSERRPHRCEVSGDKHYYKRAGDSSFAMEHYDIEDAFRRFAVPHLTLGLRMSPTATDGLQRMMGGSIEVFLENGSAITAKMPYLQVRDWTGAQPGRDRTQLIRSSDGLWNTFSGDASLVIHPGQSRVMVVFQFAIEWFDPNPTIDGLSAYRWSFEVKCRFGCENSPGTEQAITRTFRQLQETIVV